jgi:lycopene beta-cyclase
MTARHDYDVAILGAGLAGLSLAARLAAPGFAGLRVLVVEPRRTYIRDRTWSYWALQAHPFQAAVAASWSRWAVATADAQVVCTAAGLRYETIPSDAFYRCALDMLRAAPQIELRLGVAATAVEEAGAVRVSFGAQMVRAAMAFDTRPPKGVRQHGLVQIFGGMEIETEAPVFDADTAMLMDFRCAQAGAAHFTYVLPTSSRHALVEDTWFAPLDLDPPDHGTAIRNYMRSHHGVERFATHFEEHGALPMDPVFQPRPGQRLLPLGVAGGATRPSTGYAFHAIQSRCDQIARDLSAGRWPGPARARPGLVRLMDHVLLDLLARQPELAPRIFAALFARCDPAALVRFLNESARPADFVAVAAAIPFLPTVTATLRLAMRYREWPSSIPAG